MRKYTPCRLATLASLFVILVVPLLAGCRAEEQNRITMYEPGVYKGKQQAALSDHQVRMLRFRARSQSGSTSTIGAN